MARLFGTDGVRGIANTQLTNYIAYHLGQACVKFLGKTIVLGRDTRLSGDMLQAAMVAGITSAGGTALLADIIPTPGVALLVRELKADGGAMISASHNPPEYNGIKLFDSEGYKLPDEVEDEIEAFIMSDGLEGEAQRAEAEGIEGSGMPVGAELGVAIPVGDACELYIEHAVNRIKEQGTDFIGMTVAVDAGHGAAALTTSEALRRLGAEVVAINEDFNGTDINVECGSTNLKALRELMEISGADVGIAHDGDADRVMLMAPDGTEIDGDIVEAVLALDMKNRGRLDNDTVVATVMSNLGLIHSMRDHGIHVVQTKVGDRYVLEEMRANGYVLGGEQSGHMILLHHNTTGDGLMTACQFLAAVKRSGTPVGKTISVITKYPQVLINVHVADKHAVQESEAVAAAVAAAEAELGDEGRVLLRPSGTEPCVRVMVEARSAELADKHAKAIAAVVEQM